MSLFAAPQSTRFSADRVYRYELWRTWDDSKPFCAFIGLNPSTADELKDDPTIRRCIAFAKMWGCGALCMLNLWPLRATDPRELVKHPKPEGELDMFGLGNYRTIRQRIPQAGIVVAAWGVGGEILNGSTRFMEHLGNGSELPRLKCLGRTKNGHPRHPLYVPYSAQLSLYAPELAGAYTGEPT